jgi:hypothetical protein
MTTALALSALLWLPAAQAQPAHGAVFQPRLHVSFQTISRPLQRDGDREIVCGMLVIHKTPAQDPKILLPPRKPGAAARRIEPQGCGAKAIAIAK